MASQPAEPVADATAEIEPVEAPRVPDNLAALFDRVAAALRPTCLGPGDRWYIVAVACIAAGPAPETAALLYGHLVRQAAYGQSAARQALVRRLREALVKAVAIVGVCKPLEAVLAIAGAERPADRDCSAATRADWQCDEANLARGRAWYERLYAGNAADTLGLFDAHRDFAWLSQHITYGLYLGDRQVLDDLDTEMVVLPAIMSQNLRTETWWHIRGTRRIGVSPADTQAVCDAVRAINAHFGVVLDRVPSVAEVEPDV